MLTIRFRPGRIREYMAQTKEATTVQNVSDTLRGLWDQERPVSPNLVRTALTFMGLLLGVWATLNVLGALGELLSLRLGAALTQLAGGIAVPLAIWIALRLIADLVILQNQAVDRLAAMNDAAGVSPASAVEQGAPAAKAKGAAKAATDESSDSSMDDAL